MLTAEEGDALKLSDPQPKPLTNFCFADQNSLWKK